MPAHTVETYKVRTVFEYFISNFMFVLAAVHTRSDLPFFALENLYLQYFCVHVFVNDHHRHSSRRAGTWPERGTICPTEAGAGCYRSRRSCGSAR